jgi:putative membrane protein insertion efficiency factor
MIKILLETVCILPIKLYKYLLSPWMGNNCRFYPSCSSYAEEAIKVHGVFKGTYLLGCRLIKCHPFGSSGHDPVPHLDKNNRKQ